MASLAVASQARRAGSRATGAPQQWRPPGIAPAPEGGGEHPNRKHCGARATRRRRDRAGAGKMWAPGSTNVSVSSDPRGGREAGVKRQVGPLLQPLWSTPSSALSTPLHRYCLSEAPMPWDPKNQLRRAQLCKSRSSSESDMRALSAACPHARHLSNDVPIARSQCADQDRRAQQADTPSVPGDTFANEHLTHLICGPICSKAAAAKSVSIAFKSSKDSVCNRKSSAHAKWVKTFDCSSRPCPTASRFVANSSWKSDNTQRNNLGVRPNNLGVTLRPLGPAACATMRVQTPCSLAWPCACTPEPREPANVCCAFPARSPRELRCRILGPVELGKARHEVSLATTLQN